MVAMKRPVYFGADQFDPLDSRRYVTSLVPFSFTPINQGVSMKPRLLLSLWVVAVGAYAWSAAPIAQNRQIGINVVLSSDVTPAIVADLAAQGTILNNYQNIRALTMRVAERQGPASTPGTSMPSTSPI